MGKWRSVASSVVAISGMERSGPGRKRSGPGMERSGPGMERTVLFWLHHDRVTGTLHDRTELHT